MHRNCHAGIYLFAEALCVNHIHVVAKAVADTFLPGQVLVSLMRQYTPMPGLAAPMDRAITQEEYDGVLSWMLLLGLHGFTQEAAAADTAFIPDF